MFKLALLSLSFLVIVVGFVILIWPKTKMIKTNRNLIINSDNFGGDTFPNIDSKDLYPYIRLVQNKFIITEELISHFIKKVLMNSLAEEGDVTISVFKVSDSYINIKFEILNGAKTIYSIKLI